MFRMNTLMFNLAFMLASFICFASYAQPAHLTSIQENHELKICYWPDYFGISYRNPKTLDLSGIDIDMGQAFAAELGVKAHFIESSFKTLIQDLNSYRCDIAMFAIGITPDRMKQLYFSQPYLQSDIYAITTKSNSRIHNWGDIDQDDTIVAVAKGTLHEQVMKKTLKHASLLVLETPFAREQEVQAGRADVFMTDYPYSRRFMANNDWGKLIAPVKPFHVTPYAYATTQNDPAWQKRIEQFVSNIKKDGRLMKAAEAQQLEAIVVK